MYATTLTKFNHGNICYLYLWFLHLHREVLELFFFSMQFLWSTTFQLYPTFPSRRAHFPSLMREVLRSKRKKACFVVPNLKLVLTLGSARCCQLRDQQHLVSVWAETSSVTEFWTHLSYLLLRAEIHLLPLINTLLKRPCSARADTLVHFVTLH